VGGLVKRGGSTSISRGYCNWHTTWFGTRVFLRSKLEFIYASKLDRERIEYSTEVAIYECNGRSYKPDFFIGNSKIVEIKHSKKEVDEYEALFGEFIRRMGVEYEVLWEKPLNKIAKELRLEGAVEEWIVRSIKETASLDMRGIQNPRYGTVCSAATKQKIGAKAKERFQDPDYKKKCEESNRRFRESPEGIANLERYTLIRREQEAAKKDFYRQRRLVHCVVCGSEFAKRGSRSKTCSTSCLSQLKAKMASKEVSIELAFERYRSKLRKVCGEIMSRRTISFPELMRDINIIVREEKERGLIPRTLGLSIQSLDKYRVREVFEC
jgi:hypothetical protein